MSCCCNDKRILRLLRGQKALPIYITLEGLGDWDLTDPPSGKEFVITIRAEMMGGGGMSINGSVANSNTVSFNLDAYQAGDLFYDYPGVYGFYVEVALWDVPHGEDPDEVRVFDTDTCIEIYEKPTCPPPC
ncbi:MAG: hypothetical protein ABIM88_04220 [candidate division WOR-3 bacterium]